jgi:EmrB/QacA subfamily drug resistance transporter
VSIQTSFRAVPATASGSRQARPSVVLGVVLIAQLMFVLDMSIVNVALPSMQSALGFTPAGLSWVLNAYTLTFGGLLLFGARLGDLLGRRRVFVAGLALFSTASLVGGLADGATWLIAARAVQGIGAALAAPAVLALITSTFPEGRERIRALGLFTAASVGGASLGLVAGGLLTEWLSWRWVMFVNVPIGIGVIVAALLVVPELDRHTGRLDVTGAVTSTLGVAGLVYGLVHAAEAGWGAPVTIAAFVVSAALLVVFVRTELRTIDPVTPLSLFADRTRAVSYLGRITLVAAMTGTFFFTTQFVQEILGYTPIEAGLAFLPLTVALFFGSQLSARHLVERYGNRAVLVAGTSISTVALAWLSRLDASSGYLFLVVPFVLFGLGNSFAFVPLTAASLHGVEPRQAGAASGLVNVTQQVGGSLGLAVLVTVFGSAARSARGAGSAAAQAQHAFVVGSTTALTVAAALLAVTVAIVALVQMTPAPAPAPAVATASPELD